MEKTGQAGDNTLDNFTSYRYAPSKNSNILSIDHQPRTIYTSTAMVNSFNNNHQYDPNYGINGSDINSVYTPHSPDASYQINSSYPALPVVDNDTRI